MKIYTKSGDNGKTQLLGGKKVGKGHKRVSAYGTLDEVNSFIGYAIALLEGNDQLKRELQQIQHLLFDCGTDLSMPEGMREYRVKKEHTIWLEKKIDAHMEKLPNLTQFILPGGSKCGSLLHIARTVTRRAEREIVGIMETEEINKEVLHAINRLSDYFFVASRVINVSDGIEDSFYEYDSQMFKM